MVDGGRFDFSMIQKNQKPTHFLHSWNPLDVVSGSLKILPIQLPMTRDRIVGWTIWGQDILDGGQDMKDLFTSKTIEPIHS